MADIKSLNNQLHTVQQNGNHILNQVNSEKDLRMNVLHIFYELIAELENNGPDSKFKKIQSKLVDKLDAAVFEHKCDQEFRNSFITLKNVNFALYDKINLMDKPWREKGIQMIQNLTKLTDLLIDYRLVLNEDESRDKQMICIANLLHFYKNKIFKKELYVKYIYKLYDLHVQAENYTECGFTLFLHSDLFSWSFNAIKEFYFGNGNQILNQNTCDKLEWQRKEQLYLQIIDYFEKGKNYEEGIQLLKEMEMFFEKHFEYAKLTNIITKKAKFYQNILTQFRFEPEYFRVGFFGLGFPLFQRNRMFVYKGNDFEKLGDFIQRISNEYPKAEILTKSIPPDPELLQSNKQYIQIVTVKPIATLPPELEAKQEINDKVCTYYLTNKVDTFLYDRPLVKDPVDKENEFKSLWCERTILKIEHKLPSILRLFEVIDQKVYELSPVENACDTIENMNKELKKLIISYNQEPTKQLTTLTMRLQGTIDASVNGGLKRYQEAFFNPDYIETHINYYQHIKRLKKLIFNQITLLETGLTVHQRLVSSSLLPLHERLIQKLTLMKNSFICDSSYIVDISPNDKKPSILSTPLPPIPSSFNQQNNQTRLISHLRNGKDSINNGNSSEDDLYSALDADVKSTRQSLSPSSLSSVSSLNSSRHKSLNGLSQTMFNSLIPYNSTSSLTNGQTNKVVYVAVSNDNNQLINQHQHQQQRSNSMPRNNMQQFATGDQNFGDQQNSSVYPPLPPRSSQIIPIKSTDFINQSKLSLESGIETDLSSNSDSSSKPPYLPKRANKKSSILNTNLDQPSMMISIDIDKNKSSLNTVISSNATYIENLRDNSFDNSPSSNNSDLPPPLPSKNRLNRLPTSRSTTIINIVGNNDLENGQTNLNGQLTNNLLNNGLVNNNLINHFENNSLKSTSSQSTLSMSTSSSTNEHVSTESFGSSTTTTYSSNSSSKTETIHRRIQNLSLNDTKDH